MGKFDGKVVFITGGARGQGRSHAIAFAREGADVAVLDICSQIDTVQYEMASPTDLKETVSQVEALGRRAIAIEADVRDYDAVTSAIGRTVTELGAIDVVVANAGILPATGPKSESIQAWHDAVGVMMSGVYFTLKAAMEPMIAAGNGGSMLVTSSTAGLSAIAYDVGMLNPGEMGYTAAKTGVVGLMKNFARALGQYKIRVNAVHPMGVRTPMLDNNSFADVVAHAPAGWCGNVLGIDLIDPIEVSNAMIWLASDEARTITGSSISVDGGQLIF